MNKGYSYQKFYNGVDARSIPLVETNVWQCTGETCKGWMRSDMSFDTEPTCPLCGSSMVEAQKELPKLVNNKI